MNSTFTQISQDLVQAIASRKEVLAAYVFGSVASGRERPDSDIDVAVLVDTSSIPEDLLHYRLQLMAELGQVLKRSDLELVVLNEAPPALAQNAISKGKLIFERSRSARIRFQIRTFNAFLDTKPMRDYHLQVLKRRYGVE